MSSVYVTFNSYRLEFPRMCFALRVDTTWWHHQMETISTIATLSEGNPPPRALTFSLVLTWISGWRNNRAACDLRCHDAHCGATLMESGKIRIRSSNVWKSPDILSDFCKKWHLKQNFTIWRISWWRHQMEEFSALLAIVREIHRSPVNSPHKGRWCRALMFTLICARINSRVNNRVAGDLRRHRAHYDVICLLHIIQRTK